MIYISVHITYKTFALSPDSAEWAWMHLLFENRTMQIWKHLQIPPSSTE